MAEDPACKTIDPADPNGPKIDAVFPGWWVRKLYKTSPVDFQNLRAAKFVLENVQRIFRGPLHFKQGGWCYTGIPERWCIRSEDIEVPFPPGRVFAVYLDLTMRVYEIRAEKIADDDDLAPIDWQNRYGGLTWKNTSSKT